MMTNPFDITTDAAHFIVDQLQKNAPQDGTMWIWGISIRVWSLWIALPCVILAIIISVYHMISHCRYNKSTDVKIHILRILFMVPIYALSGALALLFPWNVEVFVLLREIYEGLTIYSLAQFLFTYLGGEHRLEYVLSLEHQDDDELHLYRLAQNLKNNNTLILKNKNFVSVHAEEDHTKQELEHAVQKNTISSHNRVGDYYAESYLNQYNEYYNKPWYKKIPFFNGTTPANHHQMNEALLLNGSPENNNSSNSHHITGKTALLSPNAKHPDYGSQQQQQQLQQQQRDENLFLIQDTSNHFSSAVSSIKFNPRTTVQPLSATDEDKERYREFKQRQKRAKEEQNQQPPQPSSEEQNNDPSSLAHHLSLNVDPNATLSVLHIDEVHPNHLVDDYTKNIGLITNADDLLAIDGATLPPTPLAHDNNPYNNFSSTNTTNTTTTTNDNNPSSSNNTFTDQPLAERVVTLEYRPQLHQHERLYEHLFPMNYFFKPVTAPRFLFLSRFFILQYVPVQIVCAVLTLIMHFYHVYTPGVWKLNNGYPYMSFILNNSQFMAMYGLFFFLYHFKTNLEPAAAMSKALTVKAVVFFTFWLSFAINVYYFFWPWCTHDAKEAAKHDIRICEVGEWDSEQQSAAFNNFITSVLMLVFAILHQRVFPTEEFGRAIVYNERRPLLRSVIEFFSPTDILDDVNKNMTLSNIKEVIIPTPAPPVVSSFQQPTSLTTTSPLSASTATTTSAVQEHSGEEQGAGRDEEQQGAGRDEEQQ